MDFEEWKFIEFIFKSNVSIEIMVSFMDLFIFVVMVFFEDFLYFGL